MQHNKGLLQNKRLLKKFLYEHYGIIIILAVFLALRLVFLFSLYHLPIWDESVYLGMGKYLYTNGSAGLWESIRPIGLPIFTGAFYMLGLDQIFWSQMLILLFTLGVLLLAYIICQKVFGRKVALLSTILLAITPIFFYQSGMIMTEISSLFFILLSIYMYIDKKYVWSGVFSGLAAMFRFPAGLIILIIGLAIIWSNLRKPGRISRIIKDAVMLAAGFLIILILFLIFNYISYHPYIPNIIDAMFRPIMLGALHQNNIFQGIPGLVHNILYYFTVLAYTNFILLIFIAGALYYIIARKRREAQRGAGVLLLSLIIFLIYFTWITIKQDRFIITFLPFIAIFASYIIIEIYTHRLKTASKYILFAIITALLLMSTVYALRIDGQYYYRENQRSDIPQIASDYYTYFESHNIRGSILTTDPVFAAFSNNRFIPYYDTTRNTMYINEWEKSEKITAIVYTDTSLPCIAGDIACAQNREDFLKELFANNIMAYNYSDAGTQRLIFVGK